MKKARHTHIITGLPDTYGRGRIVGDYRRVALYGIDALIRFKQEDLANCGDGTMTDDVIRLREEIARQISALKGMKKMAEAYGYDISQPAKNAKDCGVDWSIREGSFRDRWLQYTTAAGAVCELVRNFSRQFEQSDKKSSVQPLSLAHARQLPW